MDSVQFAFSPHIENVEAETAPTTMHVQRTKAVVHLGRSGDTWCVRIEKRVLDQARNISVCSCDLVVANDEESHTY